MSKQPKQQLIEEVFGHDANLYRDALQVKANASEAEIEEAYFEHWQEARNMLVPNLSPMKRELVNKRLEALLIAYRILSNPSLRSKYDEMTENSNKTGDKRQKRNDSPTLSKQHSPTFRNQTRKRRNSPQKNAMDDAFGAPFGSRNGSLDKSFESNASTVVDDFNNSLLDTSSNATGESFLFTTDEQKLNDVGEETDDEDVFAGVDEDLAFDESQDYNATTQSRSNTKLNSTRQSSIPNNPRLDSNKQIDDTDDDTDTQVSRTSSLISSGTGSSLKKGRFSSDGPKLVSSPSSNLGVRFSGIDNTYDDDTTLGDTTLESLTIGEDSIDSVNTESPCLNLLCLPEYKQVELHRMVRGIKAEVKGSLDDTVNAFDQIFNVFTIQPDECSGLVTKIETEKQTLLFSKEFMQLAVKERQKRLLEEKKEKTSKSMKSR